MTIDGVNAFTAAEFGGEPPGDWISAGVLPELGLPVEGDEALEGGPVEGAVDDFAGAGDANGVWLAGPFAPGNAAGPGDDAGVREIAAGEGEMELLGGAAPGA